MHERFKCCLFRVNNKSMIFMKINSKKEGDDGQVYKR